MLKCIVVEEPIQPDDYYTRLVLTLCVAGIILILIMMIHR